MYCPKCGTQNQDKNRYCLECGHALKSAQVRSPEPSQRVQWLATSILIAISVLAALGWLLSNRTDKAPSPDDLEDAPRMIAPDVNNTARILEGFEHPYFSTSLTDTVTISDLLSSPAKYNGHTIFLNGRITDQTLVYNASQNWPRVYWLSIDDATDVLPVVYPGSISGLAFDEEVQVEGTFISAGPGLLASGIMGTKSKANLPFSLDQTSLFVIGMASAGLLMLVVGIFLLLTGRRSSTILSIFLVLLALTQSGCMLDINTIVRADGSGSVSLAMTESTENTDFLRQIPNLAAYFDAWQADLRNDGIMINTSRFEDQERIFLQRSFSHVSELDNISELSTLGDAWVFVTTEETDDETIYRYNAEVDTSILYEAAPGIDSRAVNELHKQLDASQVTYSVTLPGEISYHNADHRQGNRLIWEVRMREQTPIKAESHLIREKEIIWPDWSYPVAGGLLLLGVVIFITGVVRYRMKKVRDA